MVIAQLLTQNGYIVELSSKTHWRLNNINHHVHQINSAKPRLTRLSLRLRLKTS